MKKLSLYIVLMFLTCTGFSQKIAVEDNKFTLDGKEIWLNGINAPWQWFNDFGNQNFQPSWWSQEFAKYKQNNINLARFWVHMSGEYSPDINSTGQVTGANDQFWSSMDHVVKVASENEVYIMPALFSFDITKNQYSKHQAWRKWIQSESNVQSYIDSVLVPMLERYKDETCILGWEICNEPEWMFENSEHGPQLFSDVQRMHAMIAAAIHANSSHLVTTGSAAPKWNSPIFDSWGDKEGNMFADDALYACLNDSNAYLDFYQYHWYPWQTQWLGSPFTKTTAEYQVDDRPVIVGEVEGNDVCDNFLCKTVSQMYTSAYNNGFAGVCAWKTPQNDGHGTFENIAVATNNFHKLYPRLVYPLDTDTIATPISDLPADSLIALAKQAMQAKRRARSGNLKSASVRSLKSATAMQDVMIEGNKFTLNGKEIWFNGINTPWHLFGDFGRNGFQPSWWTAEFAKYKKNNINLARFWVHMSGEFSPDITSSGEVTGANSQFWSSMDHVVKVASNNGVYLMPALFSFDITKSQYSKHKAWRKWLQSEENIQSYIDNLLIPMLQRYENEPCLLAWEICNEPEWMFENSEHGPQSFSDVQRMHAMLAAAVHEHSSKFVTTGSAAPKWSSPIYDSWGEKEGNMFSDEALSGCINNPNAYLDFYQYHWYPWQTQWMGSPFTKTTSFYEVDDRPVIVGESEGNNVCDNFLCQTVSEMYVSAYDNGFDGVCAWKTPQNDGHGTFENIAKATNNFYKLYPHLVYPLLSDPVAVTGIDFMDDNPSVEVAKTLQLSIKVVPSKASNKSVVYTSSNESVVAVDKKGIVTGLTEGEATITATSNDGGYTAMCSVTVVKGEITLPPDANTVTLPFFYNGGETMQWVVAEEIEHVSSWNLQSLTINGVDYTNNYSKEMPGKIDGKYYINYTGANNWGHVEILGFKGVKSLSLDETNAAFSLQIQSYPNPASDFIMLKSNASMDECFIYSMNGTLLSHVKLGGSTLERVDLNKLNGGVHLLKVQNKEGNSQMFKVVVEKVRR